MSGDEIGEGFFCVDRALSLPRAGEKRREAVGGVVSYADGGAGLHEEGDEEVFFYLRKELVFVSGAGEVVEGLLGDGLGVGLD